MLAIAQLAWYLLLANDAVGCHLGSIIVGNKLQRVAIVGKTFYIETTEHVTTGEPISDFEEFFTRIAECPMPFSLFDKNEAGRIVAEPNDDGLQAFLNITGRASELAATVGIDGLRRVPLAESTILAECLARARAPASNDLIKRSKTRLNSDQPSKPNEKKRKKPDDDAKTGDRDYIPSHGSSRGDPGHAVSAAHRNLRRVWRSFRIRQQLKIEVEGTLSLEPS